MNKKYMVFAIALMSAGLLYKRSVQSMEQPAEQAIKFITIITNDGKKISIARRIAALMPTIQGNIEFMANPSESIPLENENATRDNISALVRLLGQLSPGVNVDNSVVDFFVRNDGTTDMAQLTKLTRQLVPLMDYLGMDDLMKSIVHLYIFQSLKIGQSVEAIQLSIGSAHSRLDIAGECTFVKSSAGFKALEVPSVNGVLNLKNKDIQNLYGLYMTENKKSIVHIDLGDNQLTSLPAGLFAGFTHLEWLFLYNNKLTSVSEKAFVGLASLKVLHLSYNQLTSVPARLFAGLTSLEDLSLNNNKLKSLPAKIFTGLTSLKGLFLYINQLELLPEGVFAGLTSLEELSLYDNQLKSLPAGLFAGLASLKDLRLAKNKLTSFPEGLFAELTSLKELYLSSNPLNMTADQIKRRYFPAGSTVNIGI